MELDVPTACEGNLAQTRREHLVAQMAQGVVVVIDENGDELDDHELATEVAEERARRAVMRVRPLPLRRRNPPVRSGL